MTATNMNLAQFGITNEVVNTLGDQSKESTGRENSLLKPEAAGKCALRFIGYVETGTKSTPANGKIPAKTADNIILTFEVVTPRHTVTKKDEKTGEEYIIRDTITVRLRKGSNPKSGFMNFFKRMDYGRGFTHMTQMLGDAFVGEILHTKDDKGDVKYANLHDGEAGVYTIGAPVVIDPMTNESTKLAIPEAKGQLRCFLWANANQAMWDSLYYKADKSEESWMHKAIREADNFNGSPAQALLGGIADLPAGGMESVGSTATAASTASALDALGGL